MRRRGIFRPAGPSARLGAAASAAKPSRAQARRPAIEGGQEGGFTLLELLVVLAVLGFVVLGLAQGLRLGLVAWQRQGQAVGWREQMTSTERLLRHVLEQAEPNAPAGAPPLLGTAGTLLFRSTLPGGVAAEMALGVDAEARLVLRWQPRAPAPPQQRVLLERVARLRLGYWAADAGWAEAWAHPALPTLVRVHVELPAGTRPWPDILVRPMLERLGEAP